MESRIIIDTLTGLYYVGGRKPNNWGKKENAKILTKTEAARLVGGLKAGGAIPKKVRLTS